jgi:hypothetical protein
MRATVTVCADLRLGTEGRRMELDCRHGTTHLWIAGGPGSLRISDSAAIRAMLVKHVDEQPRCRCIRKLWREHFGLPWPQVPVFIALPSVN